ncbi:MULTISPECIES: iron uptake transporter deferrochelatase/peroxidase subunit [unclassified Pseudonocardia]|jgi:deferrochelatase/peroxidase EfeB|uniref:iron uptake transporter deferrochelatase/peroxidase subunit n=1 Tax=unclassified Pseudonocardia TaxID=2619320 RepID=UPI00095C2B7B|nr:MULTISPECIES: iron uptake transporter deferrochelatase/peroxidase subunit [unclassified Pseudonocardia]MBN9101847.1 deferrochelatase/peroxidase EfeB [Pseudonocardia sp.]OJY45009.1 MAG: peroxidase [Pseudonocardia sp. 73-21]
MIRLSRRRFFGAGAAVAGTGLVAGCSTAQGAPPAQDVVPFRGEHQAGIVTPAQDRLHFVALDLTTADRAQVVDLLQRWTAAAERMTAGAEAAPGGAVNRNPETPPTDTGEALGLPASNLTLTFGMGASFFDKLGLAAQKPTALADLPRFTGDQVDPAISGGDLCIQACADDPQVAVHAVRNLVRMGFGTTTVKWSQLGFGRTSSTSTAQATPRNLFGFKDGTNNLKAEDPDALRDQLWVQPGDGPAWHDGGTFLVARRIRMHIEIWDRTSLTEQERVFGRTKGQGAPIGRPAEFDAADFSAQGADGKPLIDARAHIRLASAQSLGGVQILRRGYNFVDGSDGQGHLNAGLFFLAYMRDPQKQFVPMQRALAQKDVLMEYIEHTSSAVFAIPAGLADGTFWGQKLLQT